MAQQKQSQSSGGRDPSQDQGQSQRKPNLSQGAEAMSEHPDAQEQAQRKPNLDQGADAMSRRPDASESGSDRDKGAGASNESTRRSGSNSNE
jgi:hypothetical protein